MQYFLNAPARSHWPQLLVLMLLCAALAVGHDGKRLAQMMVLMLPVWLWLGWPIAKPTGRALQAMLIAGVGLGFIADGATRAFLLDQYGAQPGSAMVVGAVANSSAAELAEFAAMYWRPLLTWSLAAAAASALLLLALGRWWCSPPPRPALCWPQGVAILLVAVLVVAAFASKPWRRHHPLIFWPGWYEKVMQLREQWTQLDTQRASQLQLAQALQPELAADAPDTLVLVIADSVNRDHLGLYGYPRDTTPQLNRLAAQPGAPLLRFRYAWSVDASTVPALRNLFSFGSPERAGTPHLLALARVAGYRVWWIGNHDDLAIEQEHARLAHEVRMVNQSPGRSGGKPDGVVLPELKAALADPAPRKLVVIHLMGAHPHYRLRYPAAENPFAGRHDAVMVSMQAEGRPGWLRVLRNDYDAAIRYHDRVLAGTLAYLQQTPGRRNWVYLSDHGQEVGDEADHAGHSPMTANGYRIPLLLWRSHAGGAIDTERVVRADWSGYFLGNLLGLRWPGADPRYDVLAADYRWQAPVLPVAVDFKR